MRYSEREEHVIVEEVGKSPNNLSKAFKNASDRLPNRNEGGIAAHYYSYLRNKVKIMALMTRNGAVINVKNSPRKNTKSIALEVAELALMQLTKAEKIELTKRILKN